MQALYKTGGHWYKGNLHMHTTRSDGALTPKDAVGFYRREGYDFLAVTDHWKQSDEFAAVKTGASEPHFLHLAGCELDTGDVGDLLHRPIFHIVGIGMERPLALRCAHNYPPQVLIDAIREAGGLAILAHPAWSLMDPAALEPLQGLSAAEIYNTFSGMPYSNARADSALYFDFWAARGWMLPCTAADDCHWYRGEQGRSYMMVNAQSLTAPAIRAAIAEGNFYASQGPRFVGVCYDHEAVEVTCSGVETVAFYSDTVYCSDRLTQTPGENGVTKARYAVKPTDHAVRVELIDTDGRHAWSKTFAVSARL